MKKEYDFSKGVRGKFYNYDAQFNLPIFSEAKMNKSVKKWIVTKVLLLIANKLSKKPENN